MVYIHGGEFNKESSNLTAYSPKYLMDKEIIFVSMNYRLGVLSFFTTGDLVNPGNMGLKDQVIALKWVQKNIQAFGGDTKRVTLFGNSAGGACVNFLALSDATNGNQLNLFRSQKVHLFFSICSHIQKFSGLFTLDMMIFGLFFILFCF